MRKSRTQLVSKKGKYYLKHNTFTEPIPFAAIMKALGVQSDQEIVQLVGSDQVFVDALSASLQECSKMQLYTHQQACEWIASKLRIKTKKWGPDNMTNEEKGMEKFVWNFCLCVCDCFLFSRIEISI